MKKKLEACRRWGVRVINCRYRLLDYTEDNYRLGMRPQKHGEYYIHKEWTDYHVRRFRRAVRRQNIAIILDLQKGVISPDVNCTKSRRNRGSPARLGSKQ
jgi:hypothetical protein